MNIAKKILLGYGVLLILVFIHFVYALLSLDRMDGINATIVKVHNPIIERSDSLIENLLGQEFYGRRLLILKDADSFAFLQARLGEFDRLLREIEPLMGPFASFRELSAKGTAYRSIMAEAYLSLDSALSRSREERELIDKKRQEIIDLVEQGKVEVHLDQNRMNELSSAIGRRAYRVLLIFGIGSAFIAVSITLFLARSISRSVGQLKLATRQIAEGRFDEVRSLDSADEFGDVSRSIADMARKIEYLEKLYLATNPLTFLPGGIAIDDTLNKRLQAGVSTALCVIDLDNFKAFNDRYGYARGSEVIQATARIITKAVETPGLADDFVGHIGGDDFIVVTSSERYEVICKSIIKNFDAEIPAFYDPEDRHRGSITGKNRQGQEVVFPLMSISIAVVTDQEGSITNPLIMSERAAELKEYAKSMTGSVYVIDKRRFEGGGSA